MPKPVYYHIGALVKEEGDINNLKQIVEAVTPVEKAEDLGLRSLSYLIEKNRQLRLVSLFFEADADQVKTIENSLKHNKTAVRFLLTRWLKNDKVSKKEAQEKVNV